MTKRCPYCREYIQDDAVKCRYCGEFLEGTVSPAPAAQEKKSWEYQYEAERTNPEVHPDTGQVIRPRPKNNLMWGILSTILCCIPFGIVSIVYAAKVDEAYNKGAIEESYRASKMAETWAIVSLITGIIVGGISFALGLFGALLD